MSIDASSSTSDLSTSRSLIVRLQDQDAPSWQVVVQLYSPLVLHWVRRAGLPQQETADVVQEVFRSAFSGITGFRQNNQGTFRGWLRTIARNKVSDHFRSQQKQPDATGGSDAALLLNQLPDLDDEQLYDETDAKAEQALFLRAFELIRKDVKPTTWQAFYRVVVEGQDTADMAAELGMQPGAVRGAKSRVLKRLREQLGDLPDEPQLD